MLTTCWEYSAIPSVSFSYTAGSYGRNRTKPSLILGGYDISRVNQSSTLQVPIRDVNAIAYPYQFAVVITSISLGLNRDLESSSHTHNPGGQAVYPFTVNIEPVTAQLWLPDSICDSIAQILGLQWDEDSQLYLVNATRHEWLIETDPSITFALRAPPNDGNDGNVGTNEFTLSYSSFDLNVTYPILDTWSWYFPLKRAGGAPYTLGRTFLQETHMSVDYKTGYFNLSQEKPSTSGESNIVPIIPKGIPPTGSSTSVPQSQDPRLSTGVLIGVVVGSIIGGMLLFLLLLSGWKGYWPFHHRKASTVKKSTGYEKPELHGSAVPWVEAMEKERAELETCEQSQEVLGSEGTMLKTGGIDGIHEMDATNISAPEPATSG